MIGNASFRLGIGTVVEIRGKDRCKVLNNLATQDLRDLKLGQCVETFITEPKGKVFGHGMVAALEDRLLFVSVPDQATRVIQHLDRYIIMEDAKLRDVSSDFEFYLFQGINEVKECLGDAPSIGQSLSFSREEGIAIALWAPWISANSIVVLLPKIQDPQLRSDFPSAIVSDFHSRTGWEALRIDQFWPWYGQDMDEKTLPQELDRDAKAISFNKGCYLGQETIARLDALGQVQKKLIRISIEGSELPDLGQEADCALRAGDAEVGRLRSVAVRDSNGLVGLAYVKRSHFQPGTTLELGNTRRKSVVMDSITATT